MSEVKDLNSSNQDLRIILEWYENISYGFEIIVLVCSRRLILALKIKWLTRGYLKYKKYKNLVSADSD